MADTDVISSPVETETVDLKSKEDHKDVDNNVSETPDLEKLADAAEEKKNGTVEREPEGSRTDASEGHEHEKKQDEISANKEATDASDSATVEKSEGDSPATGETNEAAESPSEETPASEETVPEAVKVENMETEEVKHISTENETGQPAATELHQCEGKVHEHECHGSEVKTSPADESKANEESHADEEHTGETTLAAETTEEDKKDDASKQHDEKGEVEEEKEKVSEDKKSEAPEEQKEQASPSTE